MKLQLRLVGGSRPGTTGVYSEPEVTLGRHPECEFVFDAERELAVSARHAVIVRQGERWVIRDLGSSNGTLVNGHPIRGDTRLDDTDQIQLGADGPTLEVRFVPDGTSDQRPRAVGTARPATKPPRPAAKRESTTQRIRTEVGRETRRLRITSGLLLLALAGAAGYVVWARRASEAERARERAEMQARVDSILQAAEGALAQLRGQVEGLADALRSSREEVGKLQTDLRAAEAAGSTAEVARLRDQLGAATQALRSQQAAARVDYRAIAQANELAVALIWADLGPGEVQVGTAFAVRKDGTLVTNRHVVLGPEGNRRPRRLAVQFTNSTQIWPATLLGASTDPDQDLAVVRVERLRGDVPVVTIPTTPPELTPGEPVATIGFPFGTSLPMAAAGEGNLVRASLTAGTVSKVLPNDIQIDGYGAQGASGSPVFNRAGALIGVLYSGEPGTDGRIVYLVPVAAVTALLRQLDLLSPG